MTQHTQQVLDEISQSPDDGELVTARLARKDGNTVLYVEADSKVTDLLHNGDLDDSGRWKNLEGENHRFYRKRNYSNDLQNLLNDYLDDFGSSTLGSRGKGNIAFLRAEGVEDGVYFDIDDPVTEEHLKAIVRDIKEAVQDLKNKFLKDVAFIGEIRQIEIDNTAEPE